MFIKFNDYLINTNEIKSITKEIKYIDTKNEYCVIINLLKGSDREVFATRPEAEKRFKQLEEMLTQPIL